MTGDKLFFGGNLESTNPQREPIVVTIVSSVEGVRSEIHRLHVLGYREATTWSKLLPTPNEGQYMSINTHYRVVDR